jgi:glucose-6-phosphate 1-dehydrogenase
MDHTEYLKRVRSYIKVPTKEMEEQLESFCQLCTYISGQYDQDESFINLNKHLEELEKGHKQQNRIFYMALPPSVFITVSQHLKRNCYPKNGITRVVVSSCHAFGEVS